MLSEINEKQAKPVTKENFHLDDRIIGLVKLLAQLAAEEHYTKRPEEMNIQEKK